MLCSQDSFRGGYALLSYRFDNTGQIVRAGLNIRF
jgi:hypothetical protein